MDNFLSLQRTAALSILLAVQNPLQQFCVRLLKDTTAFCLILVAWFTNESPTCATDWHVTTNGSPDGLGTQSTPWDIGSALEGRQKVLPGDTIWIHQGHYKFAPKVGGLGYVIKLAGRDGAPVQVRAWQGQRVTIDGGLNVQPPSAYLWVWDLEILVSEPRPPSAIPPVFTTLGEFVGHVNSGELVEWIAEEQNQCKLQTRGPPQSRW